MRRGKKKRPEQWDKARAQRMHARNRMLERYNCDFPRELQRQVVLDIQEGRARLLERQSSRVTVWVVRVNGESVPVVYDKQRKTIASVLPPEVLAAGKTIRAVG